MTQAESDVEFVINQAHKHVYIRFWVKPYSHIQRFCGMRKDACETLKNRQGAP